MADMRWWAVYRTGWDQSERVKAVTREAACDLVSRVYGIPLAELDAMERSGLGILPYYSQELGPEFSEPGPADPGKEVV